MAKKSTPRVKRSDSTFGGQSGAEEALDAAARLLAPFPWEQIPKRSVLNRGFDFRFKPIADEESARKICEKLSWDYAEMKRAEEKSLRPSELFKGVTTLEGACRRLANQLKSLHPEEQEFLAGTLRPSRKVAGGVIKTEQELMLLSYEGRIPSGWEQRIGRVNHLVAELGALTQEILESVELAKGDFRFSEDVDRGGRDSLYRRFKPPPMWWLVREGWMLFSSSMHLKPSATSDGKLHQFVGSIHEAATGEDVTGKSSLKSPLTAFAWTIRGRDKNFSILSKIAERQGLSMDEFESAWDHDVLDRHFPRKSTRTKMQTVRALIEKAQLVIEHGPNVVKRVIAVRGEVI